VGGSVFLAWYGGSGGSDFGSGSGLVAQLSAPAGGHDYSSPPDLC